MNTEAGKESVSTVPVTVNYEGLTPETAFIKVDGARLGQALGQLGYPPAVIRPLTISHAAKERTLAEVDHGRKIVFYQGSFLQEAKHFYRELLPELAAAERGAGLDMRKAIRMAAVRIGNRLDPGFLSQRIAGRKPGYFFSGNTGRRQRYFQSAKAGTLSAQLTADGQKQRARRHLERLVKLALRRRVAETLGHEQEHVRHQSLKVAVKFTINYVGFAAGLSVAKSLIEQTAASGWPIQEVAARLPLAFLALRGGLWLGQVAGGAIDERSSLAVERRFHELLDCFEVNQEVLKREVFGLGAGASGGSGASYAA